LADLADLVRLDYNKSFIWKFGFPCQVVIQFMKHEVYLLYKIPYKWLFPLEANFRDFLPNPFTI
jgi:hypothetical protein